MHLSLRLAFARTDCTPMTHCVPMGRNSLDYGFFIWQGMRDSNPRKRSQSPVCYRYTNPLAELLSEAHDYYNDLF